MRSGTMMSRRTDHIAVREVSETEDALLVEGYALLQEAIGVESVEDLGSFRSTVSSATDAAAIPKMVCATCAGHLVGFVVGTYLSNLGMGFIAYSGVRQQWRRRGVYTDMRHRIVDLFDKETGGVRPGTQRAGEALGRAQGAPQGDQDGGLLYVISEQDEDSPLYGAYLSKWGAVVASCAYEQPEVQGLRARDLKLVLQPVARRTAPGRDETLAIVREVYERIYRIQDVAANESFRRIVASLHDTPLSVTQVRVG